MKFLKSFLLGTLILGMANPIVPVFADPTDQLSHAKITHVPKMNFGVHSADQTNSKVDQVYGLHDNDQKKITKDDTSIEITSDTNQGFSVKAVFSVPTAKDGSILKDATIVLHGVQAHTTDGNNTPASDQLDPENVKSDITFEPGVAQEIAQANSGEGLGTTIIDFDSVEIIVDPPNDDKTYVTSMKIEVVDLPISAGTPIVNTPSKDESTNENANDSASTGDSGSTDNSTNDSSDNNNVVPTPDPISPEVPVESQILITWTPDESVGETKDIPSPGPDPDGSAEAEPAPPDQSKPEPPIKKEPIYFNYTTKAEARKAYDDGEIDEINGVGIEATRIDCQQGTIKNGEFVPDLSAPTGSYSEGTTLKGKNNAVLMTFEDLTSLGYAFSELKEVSVEEIMEGVNHGFLAGNVKISTVESTPKLTNVKGMFYASTGPESNRLKTLDLSAFDTTGVTDLSNMFNLCAALEKISFVDKAGHSSFNTSSVNNMEDLFGYNVGLLEITGLNSFDTSNVTKMKGMFENCIYLNNLDLSSLDTSQVVDMSKMFYGYASSVYGSSNPSPVVLTLSDKFNTNKVKYMSYMFAETGLQAHNVGGTANKYTDLNDLINNSNFDTSSVEDMSYMFYSSYYLVNLFFGSNFDTKKVTDMSYMFAGSYGLTYLDLSNFTTFALDPITHKGTKVDDIVDNDPGLSKSTIKISDKWQAAKPWT